MNLKQPKALSLLSFIQSCRFFSQFAVRALMLLFMVEQLKFSDSHALGITATLGSLGALLGMGGGFIADRFLGLRRSVTWGSWIIALGYLCLLFENGLFPALGLLCLGGMLFSSNLSALLGKSYEENDPRRVKGFTYFYVVQNCGALLATLISGFVATQYGYKVGFALAGAGMLIASICLYLYRSHLPKEKPPSLTLKKKGVLVGIFLGIPLLALEAVSFEHLLLPLLPLVCSLVFGFFALKFWKDPAIPKKEMKKFLTYLGGMILFFAAEDQISSSLMIYAERKTDRVFLGFDLPSSLIMSVNPVVVIALGTAVATLRSPFFLPFLIAALSFSSLMLFPLLGISVSYLGVMAMVGLLSIGELMVVPLISSVASEVSSRAKSAMLMGMIPLAGSLSSLLGGTFSKLCVQHMEYGYGFGMIALIILCGGLALHCIVKKTSSQP